MAVKFKNEKPVPLVVRIPDAKYVLLPGESLTFDEVKMTKEQIREVVAKREERIDYKRERSRQSMRELSEARRLGIPVKQYRKQIKGD